MTRLGPLLRPLSDSLSAGWLFLTSWFSRGVFGPRAVSWLISSIVLLGVFPVVAADGVREMPVTSKAASASADGNATTQAETAAQSSEQVERKGVEVAVEPVPSDAPHAHSSLELPAPPMAFTSYDAGFASFYYHPSVRELVQPLIAEAEAVRQDLAARLGRPVLDKVRVMVARTPSEMATLAPKGAPFPEYAAGVAYSQLGLVLLTIRPVEVNARHDLSEVFRHELAHVALHDAVGGVAVPRWFNEGFAVFASGESSLGRLETLWTATLANNLISLQHLNRSFPNEAVQASVAYAEAADILRYLVRSQERHRFSALIERLRQGSNFDRALSAAYLIDSSTLEQEWRDDVARRYTFWPVLVSGTTLWAVTMLLFVWAWRRKRLAANSTLARWAHEEAVEELRKRAVVLEAAQQPQRVQIVLTRGEETPLAYLGPRDPGVPKVEHEGGWHTLH